MIYDTIKKDVITALKAGEKETASFLRVLVSEIQNAEISLKAQGKKITDEDAVRVLKKERKSRKDAIEIYKKAGEDEKVAKEEVEIVRIETYLPKQMSADAVREVVERIVSTQDHPDFGTVMKKTMSEIKGQADGSMVREIVQTVL